LSILARQRHFWPGKEKWLDWFSGHTFHFYRDFLSSIGKWGKCDWKLLLFYLCNETKYLIEIEPALSLSLLIFISLVLSLVLKVSARRRRRFFRAYHYSHG